MGGGGGLANRLTMFHIKHKTPKLVGYLFLNFR